MCTINQLPRWTSTHHRTLLAFLMRISTAYRVMVASQVVFSICRSTCKASSGLCHCQCVSQSVTHTYTLTCEVCCAPLFFSCPQPHRMLLTCLCWKLLESLHQETGQLIHSTRLHLIPEALLSRVTEALVGTVST